MALIDGLVSLFIASSRRRFGDVFIPDVTMKESLSDVLTITDHPVEFGAAITDHAYSQPATVQASYGWTDARGVLDTLTDFSRPSVSDIYQAIIALQQSRNPFILITGKRSYANMLVQSVQLDTDRETAQALLVTMTFRQVIIVPTVLTTIAPADQQANPSATAAPEAFGVQAPRNTEVGPLAAAIQAS